MVGEDEEDGVLEGGERDERSRSLLQSNACTLTTIGYREAGWKPI